MSNYRRSYIPGGVYFFTLVTRNRHAAFRCDAHVDALRFAMRKVMVARPFIIDAMVVLPDHVHCVWRLPEGDDDFSSRWREIKKLTTRALVDQSSVGITSLWQPRFWEHAIRDEADWRRHVDYIHFNPVKHGYAACAADWPWSSFKRAVDLGWYELSWGCVEPGSIHGMAFE